ncbi:hypothetical protein K1T71_006960 [Dendrolimus kikuchii]|uniref:Uncharacterized protein n=1 Tax=Dendrolimus kikuchii TaxID=765133 RepID=A0ACC1CZB9_9NEOP|nr:hypothetical protein K1T71_006960 [Dendrolimus kikuchii]
MASVPAAVYVILLCFCVTETVLSDKTRNVLILLADDGGFEIGAYLNKICQTPNIDALAQRSVIFNNAFTSVSSCSPRALLSERPSYEIPEGPCTWLSISFDERSIQVVVDGCCSSIIGKKHVGPASVYKFDYEQTEENNHINQVGRNITHIKLLAREFLANAKKDDKPFFLYVGFHDPHRCGHTEPQYGPFCERFGSGEEGMGHIPDWQPWYYQWDEIQLPYFVQDTEPARRDIAAQYTTISRLDQGVALVLKELEAAGHLDDTLVIYTSDNGIPFPSGRTNFYDPGLREPLIIASPLPNARRNQASGALVSLLDIMPTVLDWYGIKEQVEWESNDVWESDKPKSLLSILEKEPPYSDDEAVFASQTHHEITMYYPMRAIRTRRYKLIHNLNYGMPFPIDQDLYVSPTFQDILNRTRSKQPIPWYKTLKQYYYRPQWEFYDIRQDPAETNNLHGKPSLEQTEAELRERLLRWQRDSRDPWLCSPDAVMESGADDAVCRSLDNGLLHYHPR